MWLWKKFWNTDIIGKIYFLIVLFIVVVATITVITRYKNASTNQIENEPKNEIIGKEITSESNTIDNNVITVANIKGDIKDATKQNIDKKEQEKTTTKDNTTALLNKAKSNKITETKNKKDNKQENKEKKTNSEDKKEEVKQNSNKSVQKEEYKINNNMINKMKQTIDKNKTEDMVEFGYNIIVDSSIVTKTNYFTYTDKRLISKLTYRFGTIRIYARDLYVNSEYAHTECFIY